jgi:hypothetical protein
MSLVERESTAARVAASQANGKKSKGPTTPEGKARVALNALKTGAYAKSDNALREIMLRRGENPDDFEQLHLELTQEWQPDHVTQALLVKAIAEKSFEKSQLRAAWLESQLNSLRIAEIQGQRRQLLARRWLPGCPAVAPEAQGVWLAKDSPSKFKKMFDGLDLLQKWAEEQICPDEYPGTMYELYGECPSLAGEKIRLLIIDYFGEDEAAMNKACEELPKWFAQERRDVEQERELYQREMAIRGNAGANLTEEYVAKKEAALDRQVREHTRLLLQLKTKQSQWRPPSGVAPASEPASSGQPGTATGSNGAVSASQPASPSQSTAAATPDTNDGTSTSGRESSSQPGVATAAGTANGEPACVPTSPGQSAIATERGSADGASVTQNVKPSEKMPRKSLRRSLMGWLRPKNEKTGQTDLVSAA